MNDSLPTTEFLPFPKMPRLSREAIITEKIDGTNAQIFITPLIDEDQIPLIVAHSGPLAMLVGSRTRWIRPKLAGEKGDPDNYGFAAWCKENATELFKLGEGRHYGEWFGRGINRGYGLSERRFALFNTSRWLPAHGDEYGPGVYEVLTKPGDLVQGSTMGPACCYVVPVIWRGTFDSFDVNNAVEMLRSRGSFAVPGYMNPEGVVVYHVAAQQSFQKTLVDDASPKGVSKA